MRQVLRPARWLVVAVLCTGLLVFVGAIQMYHLEGWSTTSAGLVLMCALSVGGLIELARVRVTFEGDVMRVVHYWSAREFKRGEVASVTWATGAGVWLELENGDAYELPDLGRSSLGVANTIRAWLKRND